MLTVLKRLKEQTEYEWGFHEIMLDKFPGGFHRELDWAGRYKKKKFRPKTETRI